MKHYLFLLLSLLLAACAEQDISSGGETPGPKTGLRLSVRIGQPTPTRALGDPFASGNEEKRLDRLAFFVHTAEDGFQVYPPVPDDVTDPDVAATDHPNNVYLTGTPAAGYQATVALTAGGGYVADIIALANLPADYDYRQIVTWQGLLDSVAIHATAMPVCLPGSDETDLSKRNAFVMYADVVKELKKEETNDLTFTLDRLVARIDVTNEAYPSGTTPDNAAVNTKDGFLFTSVQLLRAKPSAYLVPKPDLTPDVVTTAWPALTGIGTDILYGKKTDKTADDDPTQEPVKIEVADVANATLQYLWHSLYTYPNNDKEHAPTALEIKGTFRGSEVTRQIPFVDKDGTPFAIEGNHRYLVRILKAPGQTDLTFSITATEWDAVDTVNVKVDQTEVPEITKIDGNGTYYINKDGQKSLDVYYTQDGDITIEATCAIAPGIRVKYYNDKTGRWTTDGNWLNVEQTGETEIVTKAEQAYKKSYKVTFNKFETGLTRKAMLLIHNGGSEVECDTIIVRHVLTYPGTDFEPVAIGERDNGSDIVWAPVSVGQTRLAEKISPSISSAEYQEYSEQVGYYFQWGRKTGVRYWGSKNTPFVSGPISLDVEGDEEYQNKFVKVEYNVLWSVTLDNTLWNAGTDEIPIKGKNDPCPAGWRVPSYIELNKYVEKVKSDGVFSDDNTLLTMKNSTMRIMNGGYLAVVGGSFENMRTAITLWCSKVSSENTNAAYRTYLVKVDIDGIQSTGKSTASPVRCVLE